MDGSGVEDNDDDADIVLFASLMLMCEDGGGVCTLSMAADLAVKIGDGCTVGFNIWLLAATVVVFESVAAADSRCRECATAGSMLGAVG